MSEEKERTDEERLSFMVENLNKASVHFAIRLEKHIVQMWAHDSRWIDMSSGHDNELDIDDLRMLIDEAMIEAETNE